MDPIRGGMEEGAVGVAKGFGKGLMSSWWKTSAGTLFDMTMYPGRLLILLSALAGVMSYPLQGLYKTCYSAIFTRTRKDIATARLEEGHYLSFTALGDDNLDVEAVLEAFERLSAAPDLEVKKLEKEKKKQEKKQKDILMKKEKDDRKTKKNTKVEDSSGTSG